jgi:uncharacterized C2H2 Zn-finger protein
MARIRKFKCPKCDRTFSMAAHLARHMNTIHASKARKKVAKKKVARKRRVKRARRRAPRMAARPRAGRPRLAAGPARVIGGMRAYRETLAAQRSELDTQIAAVEQALSALGATGRAPARRATRRGRVAGMRKGSLKDYVGRVLQARGGAMAVKDVTTAVRRAGFKTKNKTLAKSIGIALSQMPKVKKVSRGVFRLR